MRLPYCIGEGQGKWNAVSRVIALHLHCLTVYIPIPIRRKIQMRLPMELTAAARGSWRSRGGFSALFKYSAALCNLLMQWTAGCTGLFQRYPHVSKQTRNQPEDSMSMMLPSPTQQSLKSRQPFNSIGVSSLQQAQTRNSASLLEDRTEKRPTRLITPNQPFSARVCQPVPIHFRVTLPAQCENQSPGRGMPAFFIIAGACRGRATASLLRAR